MPIDTELSDSFSHAEAAAKSINDLDVVVQAMHSTLALSMPWQRRLVTQLEVASRHMQVLRLTISLERGNLEIAEAAGELLKVLREAYAYVAAGRADEGTRSTMRLAVDLAQRVDRSIAAYLSTTATALSEKTA
jgi:hypothetical protein